MDGHSGRTTIAIIIMLDVAFHGTGEQLVSARDIASRSGLARRGIEPVLQILSRNGLLDGRRGPYGGYRLGQPACEILLTDISKVIMDEKSSSRCHMGALFNTVIRPFLDQINGIILSEYRKVTLHDLIVQAENRGLRRPRIQSLTFSI